MLCFGRKTTKEELYRRLTKKKNQEMEKRFSSAPFSERLVLVPHCLRNADKCKAKDCGSYYLCAGCGACKIDALQKKTGELHYKGLFILKGGRTIEKLIRELHPDAIIGVACYFEGSQGMDLCDKEKITVQFVPLTKDGCANTDIDLDEVLEVISKTAV
jgi:hypothetical protein